MRKAGIAEDSPLFLNPPSFSCSDSPGVPQEAPAAGADAEGNRVAAVVEAPLEAVALEANATEADAAVPEATPTAPEASTVVAEVPPEIDCNVEAAAL